MRQRVSCGNRLLARRCSARRCWRDSLHGLARVCPEELLEVRLGAMPLRARQPWPSVNCRSSTINASRFFGQHEAQPPARFPEALQLPFEPHLRLLPRQLAEELHGRVLLGALDIEQDVAQHVQPPRGRVAHEGGRRHESAFGVLVADVEQALRAAHAGQDLFARGNVDAGAEAGHAAPEGAACLPRASQRFHAGWLSLSPPGCLNGEQPWAKPRALLMLGCVPGFRQSRTSFISLGFGVAGVGVRVGCG